MSFALLRMLGARCAYEIFAFGFSLDSIYKNCARSVFDFQCLLSHATRNHCKPNSACGEGTALVILQISKFSISNLSHCVCPTLSNPRALTPAISQVLELTAPSSLYHLRAHQMGNWCKRFTIFLHSFARVVEIAFLLMHENAVRPKFQRTSARHEKRATSREGGETGKRESGRGKGTAGRERDKRHPPVHHVRAVRSSMLLLGNGMLVGSLEPTTQQIDKTTQEQLTL